MKTHSKRLITLYFFTILLSVGSLAQVPENQRGLYVDKFIVLNNNFDINNSFSILYGNGCRNAVICNKEFSHPHSTLLRSIKIIELFVTLREMMIDHKGLEI